MQLNQPWLGILLLLVLLNVGVSVARFLAFRWLKAQNRQRMERPLPPTEELRPSCLVVGPSADVAPAPSAASSLVIGPTKTILVRPSAAEAFVIGPSREPRVVVAPLSSLTVEAPQRAAWDDRGWLKKQAENGQVIYEGHYQVVDRRSGQTRRFRGVIVVNRGEVVPYIADPPAELRRHPKNPCFQLFRPPWFKLHWQRAARNVDDAILYIQRVLDEAINGRRVA